MFEDDGVSIMDGAEEGAFQWLTMNYLLGNLRGDLGDTVATVPPSRGPGPGEVSARGHILLVLIIYRIRLVQLAYYKYRGKRDLHGGAGMCEGFRGSTKEYQKLDTATQGDQIPRQSIEQIGMC